MRLKDSNCFGLFLDKDHKREPELAGREVYLLASLMNHSCRPNREIDVNRTHFEGARGGARKGGEGAEN